MASFQGWAIVNVDAGYIFQSQNLFGSVPPIDFWDSDSRIVPKVFMKAFPIFPFMDVVNLFIEKVKKLMVNCLQIVLFCPRQIPLSKTHQSMKNFKISVEEPF